jgi:hypothetical protein
MGRIRISKAVLSTTQPPLQVNSALSYARPLSLQDRSHYFDCFPTTIGGSYGIRHRVE